MQQLDVPTSGGRIAVVGDNASGKTILTKSLARRQDVRFLTFRDSYGYSADRDFFMQQRWNLFTLGVDTPSVGKILSDEASGSDNPQEAIARLDELTALFGLKDLLDRPLVTLSSGELRKYQIIKALIKIPSILVIDNPYIGLDPAARTLLTRLLSQILELTSLSVVLILSREEEIPPFINRIIRVENGEIVEDMESETYFSTHYPKEIIRLRNVSIKYDSRTILDSLDWVVREGEHWALTGANGCGKSTLLSLITADNPQAYACDIELFGRQRGTGESIWDIKKNIGYVSPEMHRAYGNTLASALDIVTSGLFDTEGLFRKPTDEQRAICLEWMDRFGIAPLASRPFRQLSSGEQRLCLVARAFVKNPPLYILDEPLHGLDNQHRFLVKRIIDEVCSQKGKTLLMVTHYPEEYPSCIDHSLTLVRH